MTDPFLPLISQSNSEQTNVVTINLVARTDHTSWHQGLSEDQQRWATQMDFKARPGTTLWLQQGSGPATNVVVGWDGTDNLATLGHLPLSLPAGVYTLSAPVSDLQLLGWCLGAYQFTKYRNAKRKPAQLHVADPGQRERVLAQAQAVALTRDLINTPAADMLPSHLQNAAADLAQTFGAKLQSTVGDSLLAAGYRTIHAVGRAATDAPRLLDLTWGNPDHPKVTLVGKGVCFDSGGLNIKPAGGMRTMKKDMGGAAQVMGLAHLIMSQKLPVRLRMLIPAVENAIAGNAYRPGDIIRTYAGITVEIDNTDAEGRLVLCDALSLACEEKPELIVDFATLTGAARVAVGTELSAMFCDDEAIAAALYEQGEQQDDPVWRLPLYAKYEHMLHSDVADTVNSAASGFAGATTAALFLKKFISSTAWVHFDIMAFNNRSRPGHPKGGEAMAIRAVASYLAQRYA